MMLSAMLVGVLACALPWSALANPAAAQAELPWPTDPQEALVERFYRSGDLYRAETEILRGLHGTRGDENKVAWELARAKLYYRAERYRQADLMLYSFLDRHRGDPLLPVAARLLTFSQVRQAQWDEAERWWPLGQAVGPGALGLEDSTPRIQASSPAIPREDPPGWVDPESAERWSTWLPGSGFFVADQPGKAVGAMTLNLVLLGAAVEFARAERPAAALLFIFLEALVYQGGRNGAREDAQALNQALRDRQTGLWLSGQGEAILLQVAFEHRF